MPSRKRQKGKERKAKAATQQNDQERDWCRIIDWGLRRSKCRHGCGALPPKESDVSIFMDRYISESSDKISAIEYTSSVLKKSPQVVQDADMRKAARDILVTIGTNFLLNGNNIIGATSITSAIALLEGYDDLSGGEYAYDSAYYCASPLMRDLAGGNERDIIHFYSKRTPCSCLQILYALYKSKPKVGQCFTCHRTFLRKSLMICGGCRISQFCSVKCQREKWPVHMEECHKWSQLRRSLSNQR